MKYGNLQRPILFLLYERNNAFNRLQSFRLDTTFSFILVSGKKILNEKDPCVGNVALVIYGLQ